MDKDKEKCNKGLSLEQFQVPFSPTDDSVTSSGITLSMEPKDAGKEFTAILNKIIGRTDSNDPIAVAQWDFLDSEPLSELKTPGFSQ